MKVLGDDTKDTTVDRTDVASNLQSFLLVAILAHHELSHSKCPK
jgi:hypothetical protein